MLVVAAILLAIALVYSLLLGPQILRLDFRHDLPLADILKTFPVRGWQIALGEILAPVAVLAAFQWLLLLLAPVLIFYLPGKQEALFLAIALGAAVLAAGAGFPPVADSQCRRAVVPVVDPDRQGQPARH